MDTSNLNRLRDVAQLGSALRSGRRGRRFDSDHSDRFKPTLAVGFVVSGGMYDLPSVVGIFGQPESPDPRDSPIVPLKSVPIRYLNRRGDDEIQGEH